MKCFFFPSWIQDHCPKLFLVGSNSFGRGIFCFLSKFTYDKRGALDFFCILLITDEEDEVRHYDEEDRESCVRAEISEGVIGSVERNVLVREAKA